MNGYTGGKLRLGPGTLYRSIKQMLAEGLIIEQDERPDPALDDQRRRYYRLTDFGQRVLKSETERLEQVLQIARAKQHLSVSEFRQQYGSQMTQVFLDCCRVAYQQNGTRSTGMVSASKTRRSHAAYY